MVSSNDWCVWSGDVRQPWATGYPWSAFTADDGKRYAICPGCQRTLKVRPNPMVRMYDMLPRHKTEEQS